ncbi:MAG: response regulator [Proteobacteria bacterium]|nr:response regulator [Pseudomonadota bacterium]
MSPHRANPRRRSRVNTKNLVLIVDDEDSIRKLLKARFEREGFAVETANDAGQAEAFLAQNPGVAVIVSDVKMPGKDGLTFTREVKQSHRNLKVIVMTGHGEKSTAIQALRIGACDYLEKPFDMEEMAHAVNRAMNEWKLENENASYVQTVVNFRESVHKTQQESGGEGEWADHEVTSSYTVLKKKWSENVTAAAREAAVDRSNFLRLLRRHQIDASTYRNVKKAA